MTSFVKLLMAMQLVSVLSASAEIVEVPVLVSRVSERAPPSDVILEKKALDKLNSYTLDQQPTGLVNSPEWVQNFLPSSIKDGRRFLARFKYNFDQPTKPTNTKQTPKEDRTSKPNPQNGEVASVMVDGDVTTEKTQNNVMRKVVTPLAKKVYKFSIKKLVNSFPTFDTITENLLEWLYKMVINVIVSMNTNQAQSSSAVKQEQMQRIFLQRFLNSGVPLEGILRNKGTIQTINSYQAVLPLPID